MGYEIKNTYGIAVGQVRKWKITRWGTEPFTVVEHIQFPTGQQAWAIRAKGRLITVDQGDLASESELV